MHCHAVNRTRRAKSLRKTLRDVDTVRCVKAGAQQRGVQRDQLVGAA